MQTEEGQIIKVFILTLYFQGAFKDPNWQIMVFKMPLKFTYLVKVLILAVTSTHSSPEAPQKLSLED